VDRILTTHVGSLIRPEELTEALKAGDGGDEVDRTAFEARLKAAVVDVVRKQAEVGIDVVDDGEMGKVSWITYFYDRVSGIEPRLVPVKDGPVLPAALDPEAFAGSEGLYSEYLAEDYETEADDIPAEHTGMGTMWVCTGPVEYKPDALRRDLENLRAGLDGLDVVDAFLPAVAPGSVYWIKNEHYPTEEDFVFAVADALREEYRAIVDAGFQVSVDDAVMWHKFATIQLLGGTPKDYYEWADVRVEALNRALAGIPADRVRYHICSGSNHGAHTYDASLQDILDPVLRVNAQMLQIEQGNARHEHEWRIWEDVELPDDKIVVPGVVTHQTQMVEHPELVSQRLTRLANLVGRDRVMAGTDCGFAQTAFNRRVPEWTQWAKLAALVEGARLASRELWGAKAAV
jgi:5-methyltetrahydropteroyltriglutamate--homocysteine methyltransferase